MQVNTENIKHEAMSKHRYTASAPLMIRAHTLFEPTSVPQSSGFKNHLLKRKRSLMMMDSPKRITSKNVSTLVLLQELQYKIVHYFTKLIWGYFNSGI